MELDALREQRLRRTLTAVAAAHPFYRARFRECGIDVVRIRSLGELEALPPTSKDDYIADPEAFRLVDRGDVRRRCDAIADPDGDVANDAGGGRRHTVELQFHLVLAYLRFDRLQLRCRSRVC